MNVNLDSVVKSIKALEEKHSGPLRGSSGKSPDFEEGFLRGLHYIREFVVPSFETMELDEASALEESMQGQIDDLESKHRFGL